MSAYYAPARLGMMLLLLASATGPAFGQPSSPPTVQTTKGTIEGTRKAELNVFKGIPFAAPPVGPLRWRAPQPMTSWTGVKVTDTYGASCMQATRPGQISADIISEDCLYLNVWAPAKSSARLRPVMVWMFGGAFRAGSGSSLYTAGTAFADQDIVFVAPNARVARFGYFSHPALTRENADGGLLHNYGLLDNIAALQWVKENIAKFGGDPNNVTIFGVSSGAVTVSHLMAAPQARGLFHKAIIESGLGQQIQCARDKPVKFQVQEAYCAQAGDGSVLSAEATGVKLSAASGLSADATLEQLRALTPQQIMSWPGSTTPVIDGAIVTKNVSQSFTAGEQMRIPLMVGGTSYEESILDFTALDVEEQMSVLSSQREKVMKLYLAEGSDEKTAQRRIFGDMMFSSAARAQARNQARLGVPAYLYYFDYVPEAKRAELKGAPHGGEVGFVFKTINMQRAAPTLAENAAPTERDWAMAGIVNGYWAAFAKTGNPNVGNAPTWPRYDPASDQLMHFANSGAKVATRFHKAKYDAIDAGYAEFTRTRVGGLPAVK